MAEHKKSREYVLELITKKTAIEEEIQELSGILKTQGDVGMSKALVDADGYPRNDIDIYQVRNARHRIICLQNDHKAILKEIEEGLHAVHAQEKPLIKIEENTFQEMKAFATIQDVQPQSPSAAAGLLVGDSILKFGSLTEKNFKDIQDVAAVVQHSVGRSISIILRRNGTNIQKFLTPQKWSGLGLLGCKILPLKPS